LKKLKKKNWNSPNSALNYAFWLLNRRDYSIFEIRKKLTNREFSPEEVESVIDKLIGLDFLNDRRYVENFIKSQKNLKPIGELKLKEKLFVKGIPADLIKEYLPKDQEEELIEAAINYLSRKRETTSIDKLLQYLGRRGFRYDLIISCMTKLKELTK
jgi:regulatory protein